MLHSSLKFARPHAALHRIGAYIAAYAQGKLEHRRKVEACDEILARCACKSESETVAARDSN